MLFGPDYCYNRNQATPMENPLDDYPQCISYADYYSIFNHDFICEQSEPPPEFETISVDTDRTIRNISMLHSDDGLSDFQIMYQDDEEIIWEGCCQQSLEIPQGKYINGMRVATNDQVGKITRLDFLLGGEDASETPAQPEDDVTDDSSVP